MIPIFPDCDMAANPASSSSAVVISTIWVASPKRSAAAFERGGEPNLLLCGQWPTTPHRNAVPVHRRIDLAGIFPRDPLGPIESCRLGDEDWMQRLQYECHDIEFSFAPNYSGLH